MGEAESKAAAKPRILTGALVGLMGIAAVQGVSYLGYVLARLPFVAFDVFDWIARTLPGPVVTRGIDGLVMTLTALGLSVKDTAKTAEVLMAITIVTGAGAASGAILFAIFNRQEHAPDEKAGLIMGAALALPMLLITFLVHPAGGGGLLLRVLWTGFLFLAFGVASSQAYSRLAQAGHRLSSSAANVEKAAEVQMLDRRRFLIRMGGVTATITVVGAGLGRLLGGGGQAGAGRSLTDSDLPNAGDPFEPAPGTRLDYPPVSEHYRTDINLAPIVLNEGNWRLSISGMVDQPLELSLVDLRDNYEPMHQFITLMCISNPVGGELIGTTQWTGVRLQKVLDEAGVQSKATHLLVRSWDGFYESVSLDLIRSDERIMLAYAWDNQPLTSVHGFPLRIYIPDRYGMKQPKWITSIEVVDHDTDGYWVARSWDREALVRMTAIIDTVAAVTGGDERIAGVGGIAYAGARGISRVEIQVDDGEWQPAQLKRPLSELTWVQWRYDWPFEAGSHTFTVRAFDGDGEPQITGVAPPHPSGATGLHAVNRRL